VGLQLGFVVFFSVFVATMNKAYRSSFFSTVTATQFKCQNFKDAKSDLARFDIFLNHETYFDSIKVEVKEWVHENWETWNDEQPDWFTDRVRASVPEHLIPSIVADDESKKGGTTSNGRTARRRSSLSMLNDAFADVSRTNDELLSTSTRQRQT
jgi:hypothetical protein